MHAFSTRQDFDRDSGALTWNRNQHRPPAVLGDVQVTNVFAVVGERREDPDHLLVIGDDGSYYDFALATGQTTPLHPDASWSTDDRFPAVIDLLDY